MARPPFAAARRAEPSSVSPSSPNAAAVRSPGRTPLGVTCPQSTVRTPTARGARAPQAINPCVPAPSPNPTPTPVPTAVPPSTPVPTAVPTATPVPTAVPTQAPTAPATATPGPSGQQTVSGTGIKRWWQFQQQTFAGGDDVLVNVGTGNLVVGSDDMAVPHKGTPLDFRRTYNSQSGHDVAGTDGGYPGLYGNGWTNTFDAHVVKRSDGSVSVYDVDGARYDYAINPAGGYLSPPGQPATLRFDGQCGLLWTKKSGTIYQFYRSNVNQAPCNSAQVAYGGLLHQIIGRNQNDTLTFTYTWDGQAAAGDKIAGISVTTESGLTATLAFADFTLVTGGTFRALQSLTRPDGTVVTYTYGGYGTLRTAVSPPNNAAGTTVMRSYGAGLQSGGSPTIPTMNFIGSPRWNATGGSSGGSGNDGGSLQIAYTFSAADNAHAALSEIDHVAWVDGIPPDGTNTYLQPLPAGGSGLIVVLRQYYTLGLFGTATTAQLSDTDGHNEAVTTDAVGRPLQTNTYVVGSHCQGSGTTGLCTTQAWDANNNRTASIDERGNETDFAYDINGNMIATAAPLDRNGIRPTRLLSYDANSNLLASCDEIATSNAGANWIPPAAPRDCASSVSPHVSYGYATTTAEPWGELTSITSAGGYTRRVAYDPSAQGGVDYGLPTGVTGDPVTEKDGTTRHAAVTLAYDSRGNAICVTSQTATSVRTYDAMNRVTAVSDPDDASLTAGCSKTGGIVNSSIVTRTAYYPDGSVASVQTPSEAAAGVSSQYTYDADGDRTSATAHYGNTASTTKSWYDGEDRLVETAYPQNPSGDIRWFERYIYDISQNTGTTTLSGATRTGHGGLVEVEKSTASGWIDTALADYDTADRIRTQYSFAPCAPNGSGPVYCNNPPLATTFGWDQSVGIDNLLSSVTDPIGQTTSYSYDNLGRLVMRQFTKSGAATITTAYSYDLAGRETAATDGSGANNKYTYNADGLLASEQEIPALGSGTTTYDYYPDTLLKAVSVATAYVSQPQLSAYSYRDDGQLSTQLVRMSGDKITYSYTPGGRPSQVALTHYTSGGYVPSGSTSWTYDAAGRPLNYTIPAGTYSNLTYDAEGDLLTYAGYGGEAVGYSYDVRGDLVGQSFAPNTAVNGFTPWPAFQYTNVQGVTVQNTGDQWDGRTGVPLVIGSRTLAYDAIGRLTSVSASFNPVTFTYDAGNRLTHGNSDTIATDGACGAAQHRYVQGAPAGGNVRYSYGPDDNIVQDVWADPSLAQTTRNWHWSNGSLLFTETNGVPSPLDIDGVAVVAANGSAPGLTLADLDLDGLPASAHNASGYGPWTAPNPFNQKCVEPNVVPSSAGYTDVSGAVVTSVDGQTDDGSNIIAVQRPKRRLLDLPNIGRTPPSRNCHNSSYYRLAHPDICGGDTFDGLGTIGGGPAPSDLNNGDGYPGRHRPATPHPQPQQPPRAARPSSEQEKCIPSDWSLSGSAPETWRRNGRNSGYVVGGLVGGTTGGAAGGAVGAMKGPPGVLIGTALGGYVGGEEGTHFGSELGEGLVNSAYEKPKSLFGMKVCSP